MSMTRLEDHVSSHVNAGTHFEQYQISGKSNITEQLHTDLSSVPHPEAPPTPSSTILPRSDDNFVERDDLIQQLHDKTSKASAWVALVGLGGVGKTQIAIRYAKKIRERASEIWILWLFAANPSRFDESLYDVAEQIKLPGLENPKANILQLLQKWLADPNRRWMIILDNVDDAEFLLQPQAGTSTKRRIDYIPSCNHGKVLITSRSKDEAYKLVDDNNLVEVLPMDILHSRILFQTKLGPLYDEDGATKLAEALDFMPLALSQAASFIKQKRKYSIERYLAELEKSRHSRTSLLHKHGNVPARDREASSSIILTWQISFEYIHKERKTAADLLALMSFCDRQAIPEFLLHDKDDTFEDDIQLLENFSFVSTTTDSTWDMHRLIQDAMQWWLLDHDRVEEIKKIYIHRLAMTIPIGEYENWKTLEVLLPHVGIAVAVFSEDEDVALHQAHIFYKMSWYSWLRGLFDDAISSAQKPLWIRARWLGDEHRDSIASMEMLALGYAATAMFEQAEEMQVKVLAGRKALFGDEDQATLTSMDNLAVTYIDQGRYQDAEKLGLEVLEMLERRLGEEHPDTLKSMSNLASTYSYQGKHQDAEKLALKVLEIRRRVLGEEHPSTLTTLNHLSSTYVDQGRFQEAKEIAIRALEIMKDVLGERHPDTLTSMNGLAVIYYYQGKLEDALELMTLVVKARSSVLGPNHPRTQKSVIWLKYINESIGLRDVNGNMADLAITEGN